MVQVDFYIPTRQERSRQLHRTSAIDELRNILYVLGGGFTFHGIVEGSWKDPETGQDRYEESFHYSVAVSDDSLSKLRLFLSERAKVLFDQKAIYFNVGGKVEFL